MFDEKKLNTIVGPICGKSKAGFFTCIVIKSLKIAFDIGYVPFSSLSCNNIFISHGHIDHIGSIYQHYVLSSYSNENVQYYVPSSCINGIKKVHEGNFMLNTNKEFDESKPQKFKYSSIENYIDINIKSNMYRIFPKIMDHRIDCTGYIIYKKITKLKNEFVGLDSTEIKEIIKAHGAEYIRDIAFIPYIGYTGDTTIEGILNNPEFLQVQLLITECTFYCDETRENAKKYKHVHILDIIENRDEFKNKQIILTHKSKRYEGEIFEGIKKDLITKYPDFMKKVQWF